MLVTDVGDEMCWRQFLDVGDEMCRRQLLDVVDGFGYFDHQHPLSLSVGHQHPQNDTKILVQSPTY